MQSAGTTEEFILDPKYEFSAPRFFDFCAGETQEEASAAELWFYAAPSHPASRNSSLHLFLFSSLWERETLRWHISKNHRISSCFLLVTSILDIIYNKRLFRFLRIFYIQVSFIKKKITSFISLDLFFLSQFDWKMNSFVIYINVFFISSNS